MTVIFAPTAGVPFSRVFRVKDARLTWPQLSLLEVRAQLRNGKTTTAELIDNLHTYMTWNFDGDDLVVRFEMNGLQTRELHAKLALFGGKGSFNLIVSDVGLSDERAIVVPLIQIKVSDTTTTAGGSV